MAANPHHHVTSVNHINGDAITQHGSGNIGKQVHTGPGDNVLDKNITTEAENPRTVTVHNGDYINEDKNTHHHGDIHHDHRSGTITPPGNRPGAPG